MIKISEADLRAAVMAGFMEEMYGIEKDASLLTGAAKVTASVLKRSINYLSKSKYSGGALQKAFTHATKAYNSGKGANGRAMLQSLAKHRNPFYYRAKGTQPLLSKLQHRKSSMRRGVLHSIGTSAAKIQDLTVGRKAGQGLFQRANLYRKNLGTTIANDIRGSYKYRELHDIEKKIGQGRIYMTQGKKTLNSKAALTAYKTDPKAAMKTMRMRQG